MRIVLLFAASILAAGTAWADGFSDAKRAVNAAAHNKYEDAIALYSQALESGDFAPRELASLHDKRGVAYASIGQAERAIADFDAVLRLKPDYIFARFNRGVALDAAGRYDDAIADFDATIAYDPQSGAGYFYRGQAKFHAQRFAAAAEDFAQDVGFTPEHALGHAWLYLARARAGGADARYPLEQAAAALDLQRWPGPVVALYLGKLTPAQLMDATASADPGVAADRRCQADFYSGERDLIAQRRGEAKRQFALALQHCAVTLSEHVGARAELLYLDK